MVADGLRHAKIGGYGCLSRNLILGLAGLGHEVGLLRKADQADWQAIEPGARAEIEKLPRMDPNQADLVLQVGTPAACQAFGPPSLIYTQNALGELRDDWIAAVRRADGAIVPSEFDRQVFARHVERVYVAGQSSDPRVFGPRPERRAEGSEHFTFCFVGSYGYRKGVDLLLDAFLQEFGPSEPVSLLMVCPGAGEGNAFNHLIARIQRINPLGKVRMITRRMSPDWVCRIYNRCDAFVTLSRGEGWCMPVTEALLCELPVIAPDSTAMGEYLSPEVAYLVPVREREIRSITDPFGGSVVKAYGKPGNILYEPDIAAARDAMREVRSDYAGAKARALAGAELVRGKITWEAAARDVEHACLDLLASLDATGAPEPSMAGRTGGVS